MRHYLQFGRFGFNLSGTQALVMGILNTIPFPMRASINCLNLPSRAPSR